MAILLFSIGLILLIAGAESLVRGASRLAAFLGISPLIIGLTVVAFGTSSPELAVSVKSALSGQASIAVGNVIGSNIFNILFILGLSAIITPLLVSKQLIRLDVPLLIVLSVLILIFSRDMRFTRSEGIILVAGLVVYIWFLIRQNRREKDHEKVESAEEIRDKTHTKSSWIKNIFFVLGGLVLLVLGSRWFVDGAVSFAQYLGISELVIGLTIVAVGTSLPEAVTSVIAAIHGERDIAVGNAVGSNIFNIMMVLGIASIVAPAGIEVSVAAIRFDIPVMIAVSFACLPIFFTGGVISRWEGALLFGYYVAYTAYLIMAASRHDALPKFSMAMLYFIMPLTVVTIIVVTLGEIRSRFRRYSG